MSTVNFSQHPTRSFRLLERTGGSFLGIAIFLVELISAPLALLSLLIIQPDARFSPEQFTSTVVWASIITPLIGLLILFSMYYLTRDARYRLTRWAQGKPLPGGIAELDAWRQITSIWWRYGVSFISASILGTLALNAIQNSAAIGATNEQVAYTFLGSLISAITIILITTPILEAILKPALIVLEPETINAQLSGIETLGLQAKFQSIMAALVLVSILLIADTSYRTTTLAFNSNNIQLLTSLRGELISASAYALIVGILLSFVLSWQIFKPLNELMKVFGQVEKGDFKQRASLASFAGFSQFSKLAAAFNAIVSQLEIFQQTLEQRIADSAEKLRASNEVGKITSTILDPDLFIAQTVNLIANTFSYYFVATYLIVDERWVELKDATGTAGEILKENRHRTLIADNDIIGTAIIKKEPQMALDVGEGAKIVYNPLLPYTRSELTLPLIVGEHVIGVLDVQSTREADFDANNIPTLQGMATQVAIAIENARLFTEMDLALEELRQSNRQYVVSSWSDKLKTEKLEFTTQSSTSKNEQEQDEFEIGLNLRDQNIGHIRIQTDNEWTQEDQTWVESLATQVAISLENARLIEESQGSALRERLSASIVQRIWASTNSIDSILQTAVRELGRALEASEATIELTVDERR